MRTVCFSMADIVLVLYDISSRRSFDYGAFEMLLKLGNFETF